MHEVEGPPYLNFYVGPDPHHVLRLLSLTINFSQIRLLVEVFTSTRRLKIKVIHSFTWMWFTHVKIRRMINYQLV